MKKKKPEWRKVADAIVDGGCFDLSTQSNGYTKVHHLITKHILRDCVESDLLSRWHVTLGIVTRQFDEAVFHINYSDCYDGLHVYKHIPIGKRNIQFVTIEKSYREAERQNADRQIRNVEKVLRPAIKEIEKTAPKLLKTCRERAVHLLE